MSTNNHPFKKKALAVGVIALLPLLGHAKGLDSDADERIQRLEQQVQLLLQELEQQKAALGKQQEQIQETVAQPKSNVVATTNGRSLVFKSVDDDFSFQVGGRLQADAAFHDASGGTDFGDGTAIRRLFLDVRGTVGENWNYRYQYDFARPGGSDSGSRGVRDAWIQYTGFGPHQITLGNFKAPLGLEHLASGLATTFIERGVTDLFSPDRRLGIGYNTSGSNWSTALGVFGERAEGDVGAEGDEGWDLNGRFTFAPVNDANNILHLGIAGRFHKPEDSTNELRFSSRPETNVTGVRVVDTGVIAGVDDFYSLGLEAGAVFGPFSVQGEYIGTKLNRQSGLGDVDLNAWYAYASYTLTGEPRTYRASTGVFDRPRVSNPVGQGGLGAWEVALRYSSADLSDANVIGGELENLTLGLNWYALDNLRFSANYTHVLDVDRAGNLYDGLDLNTLTVRAQIDF
ncbi:MAG: OprO/OprP family phosphate-selective porin [Bacteroidales bacterium]|nr:OprO/OprP family phosphate-selective porin [Bacteroidales bacterium]